MIVGAIFFTFLRFFSHFPALYDLIFAIVVQLVYQKVFGPKKKSVKDEIVLITGGGGDLGSKLAERFLKLGAEVVLWDVNESALKDVQKRLSSLGKVHTYVCDISMKENVYSVAKRVSQEIGNVSILVNNAAIMPANTLFELPDETIEKTFAINTLSHFWTMKAFVPSMMKSSKGHVVCVASIAGFLSVPRLANYCASKAAAAHLAESLRSELRIYKAEGINITCAAPYAIRTALSTGWKDSVVLRMFGLQLLDPNYVADRIMTGILTNEHFFFIPSVLSLFFLNRFLLPVWLQDKLIVSTGADDCLANFTGSGKKFH